MLVEMEPAAVVEVRLGTIDREEPAAVWEELRPMELVVLRMEEAEAMVAPYQKALRAAVVLGELMDAKEEGPLDQEQQAAWLWAQGGQGVSAA